MDSVCCCTLEAVDKIKYLGLVLDSKLTWTSHCKYLQDKLRKINYLLYHSKGYFSANHRRTIYINLFEPTLTYGIIHFGGAANTHIAKLQTL